MKLRFSDLRFGVELLTWRDRFPGLHRLWGLRFRLEGGWLQESSGDKALNPTRTRKPETLNPKTLFPKSQLWFRYPRSITDACNTDFHSRQEAPGDDHEHGSDMVVVFTMIVLMMTMTMMRLLMMMVMTAA